MSPDEQLQFQQLLSAAPSRPRRARDTMNINFILNEDSPRDSATASASASNADAGPTYSFSELSDFDKQFFFRPSRHTTSRTSSTMAVASTASSTTLSPPSDYSSPHLANGVGNTVNTWIETKMSDYNYNNRNNVHSTRDRPWDRNVEMYMRPEQRLYEDTLLEILNGLELPFNA